MLDIGVALCFVLLDMNGLRIGVLLALFTHDKIGAADLTRIPRQAHALVVRATLIKRNTIFHLV